MKRFCTLTQEQDGCPIYNNTSYIPYSLDFCNMISYDPQMCMFSAISVALDFVIRNKVASIYYVVTDFQAVLLVLKREKELFPTDL